MPFAPHIRMSCLGRIGSAVDGERFSFGLALAQPDGNSAPGLSPNADVWDDCAADVRTFFGSAAARISPRAILENVKFASISASGGYAADPYVSEFADIQGGSPLSEAYGRILPQAALAISLVTARRGPTGRGRFYIPMPVVDIEDASESIPVAQRDAIEASAAALITNLGNNPGIDLLNLKVCVASSKGYNTAVSGVRVGRVVDTIRSRRRSLKEDYGVFTPVSQQ